MSQVIPAPLAENSHENSPSSPFLPVLLILFFGSGCAALIYEMVWYQMLQLAIGSTTISVGVLLAAYMGGLCIGSIGLPRLRTQQHPLQMYALIEVGIAAFGMLVLAAHTADRSRLHRRQRHRTARTCCCARWSRRSACCRPRC